jgi:carbon-monoxide dehydrogenase medium subunit
MPLPRFEYVRAARLEEACALLAQHGERARVMAGGTDLILHMRLRPDSAPAIVVGLGGIPGLDGVAFDPDRGLSIGPLARLADVAAHPDVRRVYPALAEAAAATATVQIRNMGTVAGNLCNASPAADTAPPLLVHGAEVRLVGPAGARRALALEAFFRGPGKTALERGELVEEIFVPRPAGRSASAYERLSGRSRVDIAAVCVAAQVQLGRDGRCDAAQVAIGAVAPVPLLVPAAGDLLLGAVPTPELLAAAGACAAAAARPISDLRASAPYRRQMVAVLVRRALERALAAAGGSA